MESLRFVLPRLGQVGTLTLTGPSFGRGVVRFMSFTPVKASSGAEVTSVSCSAIAPVPDARPGLRRTPPLALLGRIDDVEEKIEKVIYKCRFFAFLAVAGSLMGSIICFLKGCTCVIDSYREYFDSGAKVILMLVEAIDVYLVGTVMLVLGMGLYELFISNLDIAKMSSHGSNLLGLFKLMERPRWLEIKSINELKTKLGHVIVMVLLVGMFEKSKKDNGGGKQINHGISVQSNNGSFVVDIRNSMFTCSNSSSKSMKVEDIPGVFLQIEISVKQIASIAFTDPT